MDTPIVSVIITSYNRAQFLAEAVDSVLAQTFTDWELIIVDDGSSDNAPQVAADYAQRDERITFIQQENSGVSVARNTGANKARGEFIAFLDDDDISHPQRLEKQLAVMRSHEGSAACVSNFSPIGSAVVKSARKDKSPWMWQGTGHMFRREAYLAMGGYRAYFRLLHVARNAGRRLLARGEGRSENMHRINETISLLGSGECEQRAQKYRRWLALQSLRYGKFKNAGMYLK